MNGILSGKRGLIFGALDERSIAWQVALTAKAEGADFVLTNAPVALRMGNLQQLAHDCKSTIIAADATKMEDLELLLQQSMEVLGGPLDFILHAVGMSPNVRKNKAYTDLNYDFFQKTIDISALSFHKLLQAAWKLDALAEHASVLALTYIAAQRSFPGYGDMAEAKAMLESIARSFGYYYGKRKKVRVNTLSQSPTKTSAGSGISGFDAFFDHAALQSPLGNASAEDCAGFCTVLFSDYSRMVTMQNLYHDGGFSSVGMSLPDQGPDL
jgi:enoyl-[acyl-carrier protein] reductase I